jgi:hypothetical protein
MRAMKLRRLCVTIAVASSLAGCSAWPASTASGIVPHAGVGGPGTLHHGSWMRRGTSSGDLLYVADTKDNLVDVYAYPSGASAGSLTGFMGLAYMCVDGAGDVFVPSYGSSVVFVYAHGGTQPIRTLKDPRATPYACSIDPKTGDLAVANYLLKNSTTGNVVIYRHAKGQPQTHELYGLQNEYFCAYDNVGDLFVEGGGPVGGDDPVVLEELPRGARLFSTVALENVPAYPDGLQWDGKYLALGTGTLAGPSSGDTYIYHVQISQFVAKTIATSELQEKGPTANFFIDGSTVLVSGGELQPDVDLFPYPKGGAPSQTLTETSPYGVVVSAAR